MKGKERIAKRAFKVLVAATMVVTSTQFGSFAVQAEVERQNFALNQEASANYEHLQNLIHMHVHARFPLTKHPN